MIFNLYQMMDMAIVDNTMFSIYMENGEIKEYDYSDDEAIISNNFIYNNLEIKSNVNINEIKKIALDLAKEHAKQIFTSDNVLKVIKGEYYLKYNNENKFCYTVVLNNGSYVNIDVITGRVIDTYFFNGIFD